MDPWEVRQMRQVRWSMDDADDVKGRAQAWNVLLPTLNTDCPSQSDVPTSNASDDASGG